MARTYHDAPITAAQMDKVLASMNSVSKASNNGKILCVDDFGFLTAKTQQELHIGAVLEPVTISENGTVTPPEGVDGFDSVTVNVSGSAPVLQNKIVTRNGVVTPDTGYDGLGQVTVDVPGGGYPEPTGTIQITQNGTVNVKDYASAEVNVPSSGYPEPTGTIQIAANGTANVKDYASANVNVPNSYTAADEGKVVKNGVLVAQTARATEIAANGTYDTTENNSVTVNVSGGGGAVVQPLSVTQNGTYNPPSGVDGYAPVTVNVSGGGGGEGPIYYGTSTPSASIGNDEDLYIQYEIKSALYNHTYGIIAQYRKVNNAWEQYTIPVPPSTGVHIWTKDNSSSYAAMYVQDGYWDYDNNTFVATGEVESVLYTTVRSWDTAKDCNGVALLAYPGNWQIKASTTVTDGTNTYQADEIVAQWGYYTKKDIYVYKPQ